MPESAGGFALLEPRPGFFDGSSSKTISLKEISSDDPVVGERSKSGSLVSSRAPFLAAAPALVAGGKSTSASDSSNGEAAAAAGEDFEPALLRTPSAFFSSAS